MKLIEAHENLRAKFEELIVKMNVTANRDAIMSMVENYIVECGKNSNYDQVANANTIIRMIDAGNVRGALGAIQYKDTLTHIHSDKQMMR